MTEIFYKCAFVVLWIIYILIRVPFDKKYQRTEKIKRFRMWQEQLVFVLLALGLMILPLSWVFTPFLLDFNIGLPMLARTGGIILAALSLFYFRWIHKTLGANWSPTLEINKEHQLITTGPYKRVRHPMYAQMLMWSVSQLLIISNWIAGFSGFLALLALVFIRIPREEKMLKEHFGERYLEYMKKSGKLFPRFRSK